jgi:DNA polymerase-1
VCGISSLDFYDNHIHPAMQTMTRISQRGVLCDTKVRDELKTQYQGEMDVLLKRFHTLAGGEVNPASPKQMAEFLYAKLRLPTQTKRATGAITTDEHAIETLAKKAPQHKELFDTLLDWKERQKLVSTYLDIPLSPDGRLMTSFNAFGTVTGRCNSSANIWGEGTNLQNIPVKTDLGKPLRRMFIADPGYTLVKCDLSQAEFRLVVWFAGIRRLIDAYLTDPNYDCHKWVASLIFKCPIDAVTKSQRSIAKNGVYGGNYKMQPVRAAAVYKLSLEDATFVLGEYRKAIPEIPAWWGSIERSLNSTRTLVNPLGRVRVFMDRMEDNTYRDAYSHACQSTVADIIHRSAVVGELILNECSPVLQIHDELVWSCRSSALGRNLPIIRNIMQYPLTIPGVAEPLVIPAELSYGPNWLDQTKWSGK